MKKLRKIYWTVALMLVSGIVFCQPEFNQSYPRSTGLYYLCTGGSLMLNGIGVSLTSIGKNNLGGSKSYIGNFKNADDFKRNEQSWNLFSDPSDKIYGVTINIVKEFPSASNKMRFGIEVGPSFLTYKKAKVQVENTYFPFIIFPIQYTKVTHEKLQT